MSQNDRGSVWFVIGVGGAVALGVALTPLRTRRVGLDPRLRRSSP